MKIGLHIADFTYPAGGPGLADDLTRIVVAAEEAGFQRVSVMDHLFQIQVLGPPEHEMLEAYTTLGYLAARTSKVELLAWVTAVSYRDPGMLAKIITTLDVLSKGRAWLGIGAAWNSEEAEGLGLFFPGTAERFERLEETLQICLQMWSDSDAPYDGQALPARAHAERAAVAAAAAPADPHRRRRGEEDAADGRPVRRRLQPVPQPGPASTSWTCCAGTAPTSAATTTTIEKTVMFGLDPGEKGEKVGELLDPARAAREARASARRTVGCRACTRSSR